MYIACKLTLNITMISYVTITQYIYLTIVTITQKGESPHSTWVD
jgi:hypothetical protein